MVDNPGDFATLSTLDHAKWFDKVLGPNFHAQDRAKRLRMAIDLIGGNKGVMQKSGIPSRTLSEYLVGRDIQSAALVALAKVCGVSIAWLAAGEGPMFQSDLDAEQKPQMALTIRQAINPDELVFAVEGALAAFKARGAAPTARQLVQIALALYNQPPPEDD